MPIFSRRVLQRLLDENRNFIEEGQVKELVNRLNSFDKSIATEWEVVLINALSKLGNICHERNFGGETNPDIYFESEEIPPFVADIVSVSSESYEKENPKNYFCECFRNFLSKKGVSSRGIRIDIEGELYGEYGNQKVKLALPPKKDIPNFIQSKFANFVESIKKNPKNLASFSLQEEGVSINVSYNPDDEFVYTGHLSYTIPYSLERNPIYNQLKNKANQLKRSNYPGILGIFLCDGGCNTLNTSLYSPSGYSQENIIDEVFRKNTSVSFVVVVTPEQESGIFYTTRTKNIKTNFYSNPYARYPVGNEFFNYLKRVRDFIPSPESMPVNAIHYLKYSQKKQRNGRRVEGLSHKGAYRMRGDEIKISARMVVELLAGVLDSKKLTEYSNSLGSDERNPISDFFLRQLMDGKMIEEISVERCANEDDDWIRFKFGSKDAAISEFQ
jgi:hypothetical protein